MIFFHWGCQGFTSWYNLKPLDTQILHMCPSFKSIKCKTISIMWFWTKYYENDISTTARTSSYSIFPLAPPLNFIAKMCNFVVKILFFWWIQKRIILSQYFGSAENHNTFDSTLLCVYKCILYMLPCICVYCIWYTPHSFL